MPTSTAPDLPEAAQQLRAFNRFYTQRIGVLKEGLVDTRFSLTESRLLWEIASAAARTPPEPVTLSSLARRLQLDLGYLSRLIGRLKAQALVAGERSPQDGRQLQLQLTPEGVRAMDGLDDRARQDAAALLEPLTPVQRQRLLTALQTVQGLLDPAAAPLPPRPATAGPPTDPIVLRPHRPGDIGWAVAAQGAGYALEQGWDIRFESLVARIAADFIDRLQPGREACWIAERTADGRSERLGCVFLVQARDDRHDLPVPGTAQLRMLWVEPTGRGLGLGRRLVQACTAFARQAGYRRIQLWTQSNLGAARAIYAAEGYCLVATEPHESFGASLVGENWMLELA